MELWINLFFLFLLFSFFLQIDGSVPEDLLLVCGKLSICHKVKEFCDEQTWICQACSHRCNYKLLHTLSDIEQQSCQKLCALYLYVKHEKWAVSSSITSQANVSSEAIHGLGETSSADLYYWLFIGAMGVLILTWIAFGANKSLLWLRSRRKKPVTGRSGSASIPVLYHCNPSTTVDLGGVINVGTPLLDQRHCPDVSTQVSSTMLDVAVRCGNAQISGIVTSPTNDDQQPSLIASPTDDCPSETHVKQGMEAAYPQIPTCQGKSNYTTASDVTRVNVASYDNPPLHDHTASNGHTSSHDHVSDLGNTARPSIFDENEMRLSEVSVSNVNASRPMLQTCPNAAALRDDGTADTTGYGSAGNSFR